MIRLVFITLTTLLLGAAPAPVPKPNNPPCPYPKEARDTWVTGEVGFSAEVRQDGTVASVTIDRVPEQDLGFSQSVRDTVARWRFDPAVGEGQPVASTYRDVIPFELFVPQDRARVFPVSSSDALAALERLFRRYDLQLKTRNLEEGMLITSPAKYWKLRDGAPDANKVLDGYEARSFEVFAFVSRDVEPAHVHVDARVELRSGDGLAWVVSRGPLETWLLEALAKELGKPGHPMPYSPAGLGRLQRTLGWTVEECTEGTTATLPQILRSSQVPPQFPERARKAREEGQVRVLVKVLRDGAVFPKEVSATGSNEPQLKTAAIDAVRVWRYHPARQGNCPVPVDMTATVDFTVSP